MHYTFQIDYKIIFLNQRMGLSKIANTSTEMMQCKGAVRDNGQILFRYTPVPKYVISRCLVNARIINIIDDVTLIKYLATIFKLRALCKIWKNNSWRNI